MRVIECIDVIREMVGVMAQAGISGPVLTEAKQLISDYEYQ